jgi:lipopolysaccharide biosynthesis glycosyltransferase
MYYRIEIPNLFLEVEKMVYLDCDIIINRDLSEILDYDVKNYAIGAPNDF